jgi:ABC-type branched-subunit amino acid transport system permease subunit
MTIRIFCALLALSTIIHFGFICNFLTKKATMKIKIASTISVTTGAMLLGCSLDNSRSGELMMYLVALAVAFMIYEISKWVDGMHIGRFYAKRRVAKV